jgi:hypothetical protein
VQPQGKKKNVQGGTFAFAHLEGRAFIAKNASAFAAAVTATAVHQWRRRVKPQRALSVVDHSWH